MKRSALVAMILGGGLIGAFSSSAIGALGGGGGVITGPVLDYTCSLDPGAPKGSCSCKAGDDCRRMFDDGVCTNVVRCTLKGCICVWRG